ncbi:hypothetical protein E1B28_009311 [Marasmius oreades]|uniref:Fumarylacetoacetase-like C-terminal domain-containing protein n=1 Tax=Marasmius oreades TaxID=181124 RepID=A0A9P7S1V3_9AGAR|nr:uncharacterized protein E1B28_009311 [Marasmius oreades]KAG7093013.1 hypothetical protein E1B28_009311 [Marasmius oreades]
MAAFVKQGKKIIAIGRNYAAHIKELSNTAPKEPFFFLKPTSSYVQSGGQIEIPRGVIVHHEVELGVVIGKRGRDITQSQAEDYISGYALAIDMTARNVQDEVKKLGLPWSTAKGFDTFTPIGTFIPKSEIQDPHDLLLTLTVRFLFPFPSPCSVQFFLLQINGTIKQHGSTSDMISRIPRLIEHISSIMTLEVLALGYFFCSSGTKRY